MNTAVENRLKEYRCQKEKEIKKKLLLKEPVWKRILPEKITDLLMITTSEKEFINSEESPAIETASVNPVLSQKVIIENKSCLSKKHSVTPIRGTTKHNEGKQLISTNESSIKNYKDNVQHRPIISVNSSEAKLKWLLLFSKIALWLVLYLIFLEAEWGAVYVLFSAFYLLFTNFRSSPKKAWEPSAYSVFNPGCEAIDGTLKPEQLEKTLMYGF